MKRILVVTLILVALSALLEIVFRDHAHPYFWWHSVPSFDFVYGFVGCAVIVLGSKWVGKQFVQRDEDYYDR